MKNPDASLLIPQRRFGDVRDIAEASDPAVHARLDIQGSTPAQYNDRENRNEPVRPPGVRGSGCSAARTWI